MVDELRKLDRPQEVVDDAELPRELLEFAEDESSDVDAGSGFREKLRRELWEILQSQRRKASRGNDPGR